jgi:hypothetical protein
MQQNTISILKYTSIPGAPLGGYGGSQRPHFINDKG